jgi:hypothetical protein
MRKLRSLLAWLPERPGYDVQLTIMNLWLGYVLYLAGEGKTLTTYNSVSLSFGRSLLQVQEIGRDLYSAKRIKA